ACRRGGTSFFTSGIDPGFANDLLPLALSGVCQRWTEVRILEIINYATYDQPQVLFETMGFGKPLDHTPLLLAPGSLTFAWGGTVRLLAEGLAVELEDIRSVYDRRPAVRPIRVGAHRVEPGTPVGARPAARDGTGARTSRRASTFSAGRAMSAGLPRSTIGRCISSGAPLLLSRWLTRPGV